MLAIRVTASRLLLGRAFVTQTRTARTLPISSSFDDHGAWNRAVRRS